jgi:hypothetical protein
LSFLLVAFDSDLVKAILRAFWAFVVVVDLSKLLVKDLGTIR